MHLWLGLHTTHRMGCTIRLTLTMHTHTHTLYDTVPVICRTRACKTTPHTCTYIHTHITEHKQISKEVERDSIDCGGGCIGSGQFGQVFRGTYTNALGGKVNVAVKMCKPESGTQEIVEFLREAAIMGQFDHPHIIQIFGYVPCVCCVVCCVYVCCVYCVCVCWAVCCVCMVCVWTVSAAHAKSLCGLFLCMSCVLTMVTRETA